MRKLSSWGKDWGGGAGGAGEGSNGSQEEQRVINRRQKSVEGGL